MICSSVNRAFMCPSFCWADSTQIWRSFRGAGQTEYVKTFYPIETDWFERNKKLESLLKNNRGLSLADVAKFHIETALKA
jgi:hypothetical protein